MDKFPFELLIERVCPGGAAESLLCKGHLRVIPGSREVYDALWNDSSVVAKVFWPRLGAGRRFKKERQGLQQLKSRGINTPELLFCGKTEDGRLAVVTEKMVDCPTALEVFNATKGLSERLDLLVRMCRELATQHKKGVLQNDLHLDNFMLDGDRILVLDPGQIQFSSRPVTRKRSISQLALLARYLPAEDTESVERICAEYFKARHWHFEDSDQATFRKQTRLHTKRTIRRSLRKSLRSGKRQICLRNSRFVAVFDRQFCQGGDPGNLVERMDKLMAAGELFKDSNSSYISRFTWNKTDIVAKRYNHRGLIHSLRHTIKRSRGRRSWLNGHRFAVLEVPTPRPLAYIEKRKGPFVWESYILTEYVEGRKFYYFLRDEGVGPEQRVAAARKILNMLGRLAEYGITHGDVKPSNILINRDAPTLTDLDGVRVHRLKWMCSLRRAKDAAVINRAVKECLPPEYFTDETMH